MRDSRGVGRIAISVCLVLNVGAAEPPPTSEKYWLRQWVSMHRSIQRETLDLLRSTSSSSGRSGEGAKKQVLVRTAEAIVYALKAYYLSGDSARFPQATCADLDPYVRSLTLPEKRRFPKSLSALTRAGIDIGGYWFDPYGPPYQFMPFIPGELDRLRVPKDYYGLAYAVDPEGSKAAILAILPEPASSGDTDRKPVAPFKGFLYPTEWETRVVFYALLEAESVEKEAASLPPPQSFLTSLPSGALQISAADGIIQVDFDGEGLDWGSLSEGNIVILAPHGREISVTPRLRVGPGDALDWAYLYWGDGNGTFLDDLNKPLNHTYRCLDEYTFALVASVSNTVQSLVFKVAEILPDIPVNPPAACTLKPPETGVSPLDHFLRSLVSEPRD